MKTIKNTLIFGFAFLFLAGCGDWTDPEPKNYFQKRDAEYYNNLKKYKESDHIVTFGWFGNWTATGASLMNSMSGLPDSVDFVSVWGNWQLSPAQFLDKQAVKKLKGTKMMLCFIVSTLGDQTTPQTVRDTWEEKGFSSELAAVESFWGWVDDNDQKIEEAVYKYAKSISDSCYVYDYDGFDWDLEPNYAQPFPTPGGDKFWKNEKIRNMFIKALSQYFGPRSETGRYLAVDGEPYLIDPTLYDAMDWFILQAYKSTGVSDLDSRSNRLATRFMQEGVTKRDILKKIIFTENFESFSTTGGVSFLNRDGSRTNSLLGMAMWRSVEGYRPGGIGTFHMEYDYPNVPEYRYLRFAMSAANPPIL